MTSIRNLFGKTSGVVPGGNQEKTQDASGGSGKTSSRLSANGFMESMKRRSSSSSDGAKSADSTGRRDSVMSKLKASFKPAEQPAQGDDEHEMQTMKPLSWRQQLKQSLNPVPITHETDPEKIAHSNAESMKWIQWQNAGMDRTAKPIIRPQHGVDHHETMKPLSWRQQLKQSLNPVPVDHETDPDVIAASNAASMHWIQMQNADPSKRPDHRPVHPDDVLKKMQIPQDVVHPDAGKKERDGINRTPQRLPKDLPSVAKQPSFVQGGVHTPHAAVLEQAPKQKPNLSVRIPVDAKPAPVGQESPPLKSAMKKPQSPAPQNIANPLTPSAEDVPELSSAGSSPPESPLDDKAPRFPHVQASTLPRMEDFKPKMADVPPAIGKKRVSFSDDTKAS